MKKKFRAFLADKCKDMGLTDKAIDNLVELGCEGLAEDASDEDVSKRVDALVPYAKAMQREITRKTKNMQSAEQSDPNKGNEGNIGEGNAGVLALIQSQLKPLNDQLAKLQSENAALKAAKEQTERAATIADQAKRLGIPDYLMKYVNVPEGEDTEKFLTEMKQSLVNNNLVAKEQAHELSGTEEAMKADAKSWADALPDA